MQNVLWDLKVRQAKESHSWAMLGIHHGWLQFSHFGSHRLALAIGLELGSPL